MEQVKCNLCGSSFYEVAYHMNISADTDIKAGIQGFSYKITGDKTQGLELRIVSCLSCGLKYVNPRDEMDKIFSRYSKLEDELYLGEEKGRRITARIILKQISRFRRKGKFLDIGCAAGFLLDEAAKQGWDTQGIELSEWLVNFARNELGLNVFRGTLSEAVFPSKYFDAIVLTDTIEHLVDPKGLMEEIRRILKPDGVLYISTPDIDSLLSRILKARWWGIQHAHLYYFSRNTINRLLDASGFRVRQYGSYPRIFSLAYWMERLKGYNKTFYAIFRPLLNAGLKKILIKINFHDQIALIAERKRSLSFIAEDESKVTPSALRKKTVVVLPAYNAAKTLESTLKDIPKVLVDDIILVDDASKDNTVELATDLGLQVFMHPKTLGYGANQKTCYKKALEMGAEIIVMVHPDYQYDPTIIPSLIEPIQNGTADAVFGSRMMKGGALEGGMPLWKHNINILLTAIENIALGTYLTEYHSGFRAYSSKYLNTVNFMANSNSFIFDNEMVVQGIYHCLKIEEIPIRTRYFDEASTIKFLPSIFYGFGVLKTILKYILHVNGVFAFRQFGNSELSNK
ncbi:MAG: methyltransferase domain-containing protein [Candidatus Omnitrophota bacterium]|jgi:SAM-dependent methyltransferase